MEKITVGLELLLKELFLIKEEELVLGMVIWELVLDILETFTLIIFILLREVLLD